ncbi:pantoate--beta-alanine ligase [Sphingopyxis alaskensis]|uniref:Pantothenate synthetase n=1 Tax=Sphingopyxis alaskensis (strain DSM 13593 / LMG 18877 / RB2256) TaxID=317655 RepID=PANC_SPHAL|nr:pantoate--beta-alanine ligase [Sphingopyxis alaskensis]Q1GNR4.1 RecName: Full=Pantothenate synthetase; Short=PS; AltName: Full=Pantoate--beta-alanine ligase; AltName: Full=Pantoate-activating enzyme [Sphingopyxis alaskensis RB2256]ABF54708.1 pantothenate synthetase [Sphingopyxis alaskensis RB2256]MCM3418451.1 pantoate--beta-alanine ligase [Sphingopyxis alaskensis]
MQIIRDIAMLHRAVTALKQGGKSIALVPTMGALHAGHLSLVRMAKRVADHVVVSIFVNPTQFGPNEDFAAYPRDEARDAALLVEEGTSLLWAPDVGTMYPGGHSTHVEVAELGADYCGAARPGHFDGVATVVAKLFNQVRPDIAIFGEKDWQQLAIIRRMARDLDFGIDILGAPIAREADGLALSSRNAYLSAEQRTAAAAFPGALKTAAKAIADGADVAETLARAEAAIVGGGFDSVDYVALADADSLERLAVFRAPARLLAAARIGRTRLIDNLPVG